MTNRPFQILNNSPMKIREEHYISKNPFSGEEISAVPLGKRKGVKIFDTTSPHQRFEKHLPCIAQPLKDSEYYFFQDGEVFGRIEFKPLTYRHDTDKPRTFKYQDKVILRWQPNNKKPSELLKILDEFGFKKE